MGTRVPKARAPALVHCHSVIRESTRRAGVGQVAAKRRVPSWDRARSSPRSPPPARLQRGASSSSEDERAVEVIVDRLHRPWCDFCSSRFCSAFPRSLPAGSGSPARLPDPRLHDRRQSQRRLRDPGGPAPIMNAAAVGLFTFFFVSFAHALELRVPSLSTERDRRSDPVRHALPVRYAAAAAISLIISGATATCRSRRRRSSRAAHLHGSPVAVFHHNHPFSAHAFIVGSGGGGMSGLPF